MRARGTQRLPASQDYHVFDPETVHTMGLAFDDACRTLGLVHKTDKATAIVATRIIEIAGCGEHDRAQLTQAVLKTFEG